MTHSAQPKRVLIVDDEPGVAMVLVGGLRKLGSEYAVETAGSGEEALEKIQRSTYALVVTDYKMPGMSGLDLAQEVRQIAPATPVVLMTAYGTAGLRDSASHLALEYIDKPFPIDQLRDIVKRFTSPRDTRRAHGPEPGILILSEERFEALTRSLAGLRSEIGSQCVLLADGMGQLIADVGITQGIDTSTLLSLIGGGLAATFEMARHLGQPQALNLNYQEGEHYDVYSANVGDHLFLAILYDKKVQASRIGAVWLYAKRTIKQLLEITATVEMAPVEDLLSADFDSSMSRELDNLFGDEPPAGQQDRGHRAADVPAAASHREPPAMTEESSGFPLLFNLEEALAAGLVDPARTFFLNEECD